MKTLIIPTLNTNKIGVNTISVDTKHHTPLFDGTRPDNEKNIQSSKGLRVPSTKGDVPSPFITANTEQVNHHCLKNDCIIPVFAKDNEKTIAHQEFIEIAQECVKTVFKHQEIDLPEIRVSHQVKGRIPEAIHKSAKELLDHEKTQYFERMAFAIRIPSITETVNGNPLSLMVGGVRWPGITRTSGWGWESALCSSCSPGCCRSRRSGRRRLRHPLRLLPRGRRCGESGGCSALLSRTAKGSPAARW